MNDGSKGLRQQLEQIAGMLGCSVDTFTSETERLTDTAELLRLWSAIPDEAGRARVLACAREAVGDGAPP